MSVDVGVLGGGPAGSVLALRLAQLGHRVVLIDRPTRRPHGGESLSPAIWPLADRAGLRPAVESAVLVGLREAELRWRGPEVETVRLRDTAFVDRNRLDERLRDAARLAGVRVIRGTARRPARTPDGWRLRPDGDEIAVPVVADATGRRRLLGGPRPRTARRTLAVYGFWDGPAPPPSRTCLDTFDDGWLWGARVPGGLHATVFLDPRTVAEHRRRIAALYDRTVTASPLLGRLAAGLTRAGPVRVLDATAFAVPDVVGAGHIRVGEAAFAVDPLSSSGVLLATQTALAAAVVVNTVLRHPDDEPAAGAYYRDLVRRLVDRHAAATADRYAEHPPGSAGFWEGRGGRPAPHRPPVPVRPTRRVRLSPAARTVDLPCLVGDLVRTRTALVHPALPQPVAFLGDVEIGPILADLAGAPLWSVVSRRWRDTLGERPAAAVTTWLLTYGLIADAGLPPSGAVASGTESRP